MPTIMNEFYPKVIEVGEQTVNVRFWDTAGQELFHSITHNYYKKSDGVVLCYDISNKRSFERADFWAKEIRNHCRENTPVLLLGNKSDLREIREVKEEEGVYFAKSKELYFMETSAKTNEGGGVDVAFKTILKEAIRKFEKINNLENFSEFRQTVKVSQFSDGDVSEEAGEDNNGRKTKNCCG